jgi:hypothetical protein
MDFVQWMVFLGVLCLAVIVVGSIFSAPRPVTAEDRLDSHENLENYETILSHEYLSKYDFNLGNGRSDHEYLIFDNHLHNLPFRNRNLVIKVRPSTHAFRNPLKAIYNYWNVFLCQDLQEIHLAKIAFVEDLLEIIDVCTDYGPVWRRYNGIDDSCL